MKFDHIIARPEQTMSIYVQNINSGFMKIPEIARTIKPEIEDAILASKERKIFIDNLGNQVEEYKQNRNAYKEQLHQQADERATYMHLLKQRTEHFERRGQNIDIKI